MRITESKLRRIIRQVIKESIKDQPFKHQRHGHVDNEMYRRKHGHPRSYQEEEAVLDYFGNMPHVSKGQEEKAMEIYDEFKRTGMTDNLDRRIRNYNVNHGNLIVVLNSLGIKPPSSFSFK